MRFSKGSKEGPRGAKPPLIGLRSHDQIPANGGDVARDCNWPGKGLLHIIIQQLPNKDRKLKKNARKYRKQKRNLSHLWCL